MTTEQQIKALAELDGWRIVNSYQSIQDGQDINWWRRDESSFTDCVDRELPHYLTSYDAIIPLIQKMNVHKRNDLIASLWKICGNEPSINFWNEYNFRGLFSMLVATPAQLCEALLRATGKWIE